MHIGLIHHSGTDSVCIQFDSIRFRLIQFRFHGPDGCDELQESSWDRMQALVQSAASFLTKKPPLALKLLAPPQLMITAQSPKEETCFTDVYLVASS